ncbi:MAG TPA: DUF3090 family protein [Candidatus Limnocylindrales bacterium]|nr:DUF3090 family protein [Candidatus Limnocylindrales bacterium]
MARRLFIFDQPDRFVPGTIGDPGERTFFLQARKGESVVSVALEKAQVTALAARLADLLAVVEEGESVPLVGQPDEGPLDEPLVQVFRVGAMALSWDPTGERVVIEAQPEDEGGAYVATTDEADEGPDLMRVRIEPSQAHAFIRRAERLIAAGRPPCPFCGQPLEPTGHFCVRTNGQLN